MEGKRLIVGFDLGREYSQVSIRREGKEPESVGILPGNNRYMIPTVLCVRYDNGEWLFGEEAIRCNQREAGYFLDKLIDKVVQRETVLIDGTEYTGAMLLERFFRKALASLRLRCGAEGIERLVVTSACQSEALSQAICDALLSIGLRREQIQVQSYLLSFLQYSVSQPKELWTADVGLFDFRPEGLFYYQMSTVRRQAPMPVSGQMVDLTDLCEYEQLQTLSAEEMAKSFREIVNKLLGRHIYSAIYFTGSGFEGSWCDGLLRELSQQRRVFKGQNLFVKGAAYGASALTGACLQEFLFLTPEELPYSVSIRMFQNDQLTAVPLVAAGSRYKEVNVKTVGILDETDEIFFTVNHVLKKESRHIVMNLRNLTQRENKTTRIRVKLTFLDRDTLVIHVKDLGFGEFYPNSNRVWEKVVEI